MSQKGEGSGRCIVVWNGGGERERKVSNDGTVIL